MPRGKIFQARKAVSEQLRRFVASLLAQFKRPPEALLQKAEAKLAERVGVEGSSEESGDGRRSDEPRTT